MNKKRIIMFVLIALGVIAIDQISKAIMIHYLLEAQSVTIIKGFSYLTLVYNPGAAWSMFQGWKIFLIIASFLVSIWSVYESLVSKMNLTLISGAIFTGGVLGNLIDRIISGNVTDFLDFRIFGYDFPVFNFADIFIFIGAIMFAICFFKEDKYGKSS